MRNEELGARMRTYRGYRQPGGGPVSVTVEGDDGVRRPLDPRFDLLFLEGGFEWGWHGDGGQLALAMVADALRIDNPGGYDVLAVQVYQRFKVWVVSRLPAEGWVLYSRDVFEPILDALYDVLGELRS